MLHTRITVGAGLIFIILLCHMGVQAATVEYELTIAQEEITITGRPAWAMTITEASQARRYASKKAIPHVSTSITR